MRKTWPWVVRNWWNIRDTNAWNWNFSMETWTWNLFSSYIVGGSHNSSEDLIPKSIEFVRNWMTNSILGATSVLRWYELYRTKFSLSLASMQALCWTVSCDFSNPFWRIGCGVLSTHGWAVLEKFSVWLTSSLSTAMGWLALKLLTCL